MMCENTDNNNDRQVNFVYKDSAISDACLSPTNKFMPFRSSLTELIKDARELVSKIVLPYSWL